LIPVISDAKLHAAAEKLVGPGFSQDCDWHNQQCVVKRAGGVVLAKFDPSSEENWEV